MPELTVTTVAVAIVAVFGPPWAIWATTTLVRVDKRVAIMFDRWEREGGPRGTSKGPRRARQSP